MRIATVLFPVLTLGAFTCAFPAHADPVLAGATFLGGLGGAWSVSYNTGDSGLNLEQVTFNLSPTNLAFDTAAGGFGSLAFHDIGHYSGSDVVTGLTGTSPTGAALDGGKLLSFTFSDFTAGDAFTFLGDVDHPNPVLVQLQDCTGKKGLALIACNASNVAAVATNDARLLAAETVLPNAMAGATVTFQFGGFGFEDLTLTATFQSLTVPQIISGLAQGNGVRSFSVVAATPEPASFVMLVGGLALNVLCTWLRTKRRAT